MYSHYSLVFFLCCKPVCICSHPENSVRLKHESGRVANATKYFRRVTGIAGVVTAAAKHRNSYMGDTVRKFKWKECKWVDGWADRWIDNGAGCRRNNTENVVGKERCNVLPGGVQVFVEFYFRMYSRWLRWECSSCHYVACDTAVYICALARPFSSRCRLGWIVSPCSSPFSEAKLDFMWSNGVLHDVSWCMHRSNSGIRLFIYLFIFSRMRVFTGDKCYT